MVKKQALRHMENTWYSAEQMNFSSTTERVDSKHEIYFTCNREIKYVYLPILFACCAQERKCSNESKRKHVLRGFMKLKFIKSSENPEFCFMLFVKETNERKTEVYEALRRTI